MNTTSLMLNGRTAWHIENMIPKARASLIGTPSPIRPAVASRPSSSSSSPRSRTVSRDSPGWYLNAETTPTLEDFAKRTKTFVKRIERWQGVCAQNIVMALMRPTPMMLFFFHPIALLTWALVLLLWMAIRGSGSES